MSGTSDENSCPICKEMMGTYSDYKPFDTVNGECYNCGFCYYTKVEQMDLEEVNEKRKEFNENNDKQLKPLTQKDLDKWKKEIESI